MTGIRQESGTHTYFYYEKKIREFRMSGTVFHIPPAECHSNAFKVSSKQVFTIAPTNQGIILVSVCGKHGFAFFFLFFFPFQWLPRKEK